MGFTVNLSFITSQENGLHSMHEHTRKAQLLARWSYVCVISQGLNFHVE